MKFKYTLFSIFFVSCSIDVDSINSSSDLKKTSVVEFDVFPQNSGRIIDQFSCVGWNELIGCPLSLESYHNNSNVELTAIPSGNFKFQRWTGDIESTDNPLRIVINADIKIVAEFYE